MNAQQALELAAKQAGLDSTDAELIRAGENTLFRLVGGVVARVGRPGQEAAARKEVQVSRWLSAAGIAVVDAMPEITQPIVTHDVPVTFWRELPPHREGSVDQVADVLRQLHALQPPPDLDLPPLAPFVRLDERIAEATAFSSADRQWLHKHLRLLQQRYAELPVGLPRGAVHGDAWGGNIVATTGGPVVLDLERFAYGPPEWDLASIAVDHFTFGSLSGAEWAAFCRRYGHDVTDWTGYTVLRDARELRKVTFAAQMASQHPHLREHAQYRLACIRGLHGDRPWHWQPVP